MPQLESLLSIARAQSELRLAALQKKRQSIAFLNQQLLELIEYSRSYQQSVVGTDDNLSTLLSHRQRFISRLSKQIDELTNRISIMTEDVAECAEKWHLAQAKHKAIESIQELRCSQARYSKAKIEQDKSDEFSRFSTAADLYPENPMSADHA